MYFIISLIFLISSLFLGGGYKFIAMAGVSGLFAIADSLLSIHDSIKQNNKK